MADRILLLVGTKKGAFVLYSDQSRRAWQVSEPMCDGWPIQDINVDPKTGTWYAGGGSSWYGGTVFRSDDFGATWTQSSEGLTYGDDGPKITAVWNVTPRQRVALRRRRSGRPVPERGPGQTWAHVEGLRNHPSQPTWQPGAGGLILHSIVPHPTDRARMWVAISSVGTFETQDDGATWEPRNSSVRACFQPDVFPETGQCVHKLVMSADEERLYQQNHCGAYRSLDSGRTWTEITPGLPSEFGFAMTAHPRDPLTVWNIPLTGPRRAGYMPGGAAAVWRTHDGGDTWLRGDSGCRSRTPTWASCARRWPDDDLEPVGVYFGTSTGHLYGSADGGVNWDPIVTTLPPIWSVEAVRIPG